MAGSMRIRTKGAPLSLILILCFSLLVFGCDLFSPPQNQTEEEEQTEKIEETPAHPIIGYWVPTGSSEVIYRFTGIFGENNVFYGNRTRIMTGDTPGVFHGGTIEIHSDIIKIWSGERYQMAPTYEYQISIDGDTMRWYQKYTTTLVTTYTRVEGGLE